MSEHKTKTEEIQYLGGMLTATTIEDVKRMQAILNRLYELIGVPYAIL